MPSIEIVCEGQRHPLDVSGYPFAVEVNENLLSHRSPTRFEHEFRNLEGYIYHLGDPSLKTNTDAYFFQAYELLSPRLQASEEGVLEFREEYLAEIKQLIRALINEASTGQVIFTTDWQLGPEGSINGGRISESEFWNRHQNGKLRINAIYRIYRV